jgi:hypothetical protein
MKTYHSDSKSQAPMIEIAMSMKNGCKRKPRRTAEGTSATVANKSQIRPYEQMI